MDAFAKELAKRLGTKSPAVGDLFHSLLRQAEGSEARLSFETWKQLLTRAGGHDWWKLGPRQTAAIGRTYQLDASEVSSERSLFAIHSCYVTLASILARRALLDTPYADSWDAFDEPFDWCRDFDDETIQAIIEDISPAALRQAAASGMDLLRDIYHGLVPRLVRHGLGEYYTPTWLAAHVLDSVGLDGTRPARILDPACGSGTFLLQAAARLREKGTELRGTGGVSPACLAGFDLNPVAVAAARANLVMATADLGIDPHSVAASIAIRDSILDDADEPPEFDHIVGNPPWIAWDHLPQAYRDATKPLWSRYGLFSLSGDKARYGGGKKDLSTLLLYTVADRFLKNGGRLGFVVPQTLFQTKDAGEGFRRFRLGPEGASLKVLRVDDFSRFKPFPGASNWTAVVTLEKGEPTVYPVPYYEWSNPSRKEAFEARPINAAREGAPWMILPKAFRTDPTRLVGPSDYTARLGVNTGGANGVYWLEVLDADESGVRIRNLPGRGKQVVPQVKCTIEPDLVYPLVRWADVRRGAAEPSVCILLAQDPNTRTGIPEDRMRREYPKTFAYLSRFKRLLVKRAAYRRYQSAAPFYSMYNVGPDSIAARKVIWRRMDRRINAAIVEARDDPRIGRRPVLCQETCVEIAVSSEEEAFYLLAELNGSIVNFIAQAHHVRGGKSFGSPGTLEFLGVRRFDPESEMHRELVKLGRELHAEPPCDELMERIDIVSAGMRRIPDRDAARMRERVES